MLRANRGLFDALELVFPVRFEPREAGDVRDLDAAVMLGDTCQSPPLPCLIAPQGHLEEDSGSNRQGRVQFTSDGRLDQRLRGTVLHDARAANLKALTVDAGEQVVAKGPTGPVWTNRSVGNHCIHRVALTPAQPDSALPLRAQMREGQFLSLLPLVAFLREVTEAHQWSRPPLRACFVIDDPNLRHPTYGFVDFRALASRAASHGYHVAVAHIPLDSWPVCRTAARAFIDNPRSLSLLVHGNQHLRHELERFRSVAEARGQMSQALRRVAALERRAGVRIDRVMAAPHERCSPVATEAMLQVGFQALIIDRANPWRFRPEEERPVAGWELAELVSGGLPVMRREHVDASREDLVLRSFLDQPLILYAHHIDLSDGYDRLAAAAEEINQLGDVEWISLGEIARTNYLLRDAGPRLTVRMLCRTARVALGAGISEVSVEVPSFRGAATGEVSIGGSVVRLERDGAVVRTQPLQVTGGTADIAIHVPQCSPVATRVRPLSSTWGVARRLVAESRDRLQPIGHRVPRDAA